MTRRTTVAMLLAVAAAPAVAQSPPKPAPTRMSGAECEVWARELSFAQSVADHDADAFERQERRIGHGRRVSGWLARAPLA